MKGLQCPGELELARGLQSAVDGAPAPELESHLAACADCRDSWDSFGRVIGLARALPLDLPSAARRDEVRASLLAAAESGQAPGLRRSRRGAVWLASAAAAVVALAWFVRQPTPNAPATHAHATVHPRPGAAFSIVSPPPDEKVRLRGGTIALEVSPLGPRERFRVLVGDDEVEVHGTVFEVSADVDRLTGVTVTSGRVEVRPGGGRTAVLGPGESWRDETRGRVVVADVPPAAPVLVPDPPPRPERVRARARRPQPSLQETLYDDAWDAMRASNFKEAAAAFARVVDSSPEGPLADDGAFWRAVAVARAGDSVGAMAMFRRLLDDYPKCPRRGEASAMLGWLLIDAKQPDEAAIQFRAAVGDASASVRASARQGLEALGIR